MPIMVDHGLNISYEQMRSLVLEYLKGNSTGQMAEVARGVESIAIRQHLVPIPEGHRAGREGGVINGQDFGWIIDIIWDLVIEGVIRWGLNDGSNNELPFYHVTEYGIAVIKDGPHSPYDPDGYLKRIKTSIPSLDPVIQTYLNESLHTLRIGCVFSSAITLGCASEKSLLLLIEAYAASLSSARQNKFREKTEGRMIKRQFDEFRKQVEGDLKSRLPDELEDGLDIQLTALFEMIRTQRNDAGHPTGKAIEREQVYASLVVFPTYLKRLYRLIDWVRINAAP